MTNLQSFITGAIKLGHRSLKRQTCSAPYGLARGKTVLGAVSFMCFELFLTLHCILKQQFTINGGEKPQFLWKLAAVQGESIAQPTLRCFVHDSGKILAHSKGKSQQAQSYPAEPPSLSLGEQRCQARTSKVRNAAAWGFFFFKIAQEFVNFHLQSIGKTFLPN